MPSSEAILGSLTLVANQWRAVAIVWHLLLGTLVLAWLVGYRPSNRLVARLLTMPLFSVSIVAWWSGNPFNGATFAVLALFLMTVASRFSTQPVRLASSLFVVTGSLLVAFAWVYPHFLDTEQWTEYAYAAPLGLLPCPTLAAVIGVTLALGLFRSTFWAATLAASGLVYGAIGVFGLEVSLDYVLLFGALALIVSRMGFL